jgi:hypothetical protein
MLASLDAKMLAAQSDVLLSSRHYLLASLSALDGTVPDSICGNLGESGKISIFKTADEYDPCREDTG